MCLVYFICANGASRPPTNKRQIFRFKMLKTDAFLKTLLTMTEQRIFSTKVNLPFAGFLWNFDLEIHWIHISWFPLENVITSARNVWLLIPEKLMQKVNYGCAEIWYVGRKLTSSDGWKISPSGSWHSDCAKRGSNNFRAPATSQKPLSRTLNGSRCLIITPRSMALYRASVDAFEKYFQWKKNMENSFGRIYVTHPQLVL